MEPPVSDNLSTLIAIYVGLPDGRPFDDVGIVVHQRIRSLGDIKVSHVLTSDQAREWADNLYDVADALDARHAAEKEKVDGTLGD